MAFDQYAFQREVDLAINEARGRGYPPATISGWLTPMQTALGTDTTTHGRTIETPPAALDQTQASPGQPQPPFHRSVMNAINRGKAGNLSTANMAAWLGNIVTALGGEPASAYDITLLQPLSSLLVPGQQHS